MNTNNTEVAFRYKETSDLRRARLLFKCIASPVLTAAGIEMVKAALALRLPINGLLKRTLFKQFCGGETLKDTANVSRTLNRYNVKSILDYGVEGEASEAAYYHAAKECIRAIHFAGRQGNIPFISVKITGYARFELLEKKHEGKELTNEEQKEWKRVVRRITNICEAAADQNIKVLIDAEETWIQEPCNEITELMMETFNHDQAIVFNTYQMYCSGTLPFLKDSILKAEQRGYKLGAKLVRGAYMEKERSRASQLNYPDPIQPDKESTDRDFDKAVEVCLQHHDSISLFIGTHNEKSCVKATEIMSQLHISPNDDKIFFSQLYGMSDHLSFNLADDKYNVAKYIPYGPVKSVVPYLLRRATENTSVAGQTGRELEMIEKEIKRRGRAHS